jgi:hypothetical protein
MGLPALQLEVLAGGDPLRQERLIHDLHEHLVADESLAAAGVTIAPAPPLPARRSKKGTVETVVALLVAGAPYAQPVADVLTAALEKWCSRDRRVSVRLRDGDRTVEIVGNPTKQQKELLEEFWQRSDGGSGS